MAGKSLALINGCAGIIRGRLSNLVLPGAALPLPSTKGGGRLTKGGRRNK